MPSFQTAIIPFIQCFLSKMHNSVKFLKALYGSSFKTTDIVLKYIQHFLYQPIEHRWQALLQNMSYYMAHQRGCNVIYIFLIHFSIRTKRLRLKACSKQTRQKVSFVFVHSYLEILCVLCNSYLIQMLGRCEFLLFKALKHILVQVHINNSSIEIK